MLYNISKWTIEKGQRQDSGKVSINIYLLNDNPNIKLSTEHNLNYRNEKFADVIASKRTSKYGPSDSYKVNSYKKPAIVCIFFILFVWMT